MKKALPLVVLFSSTEALTLDNNNKVTHIILKQYLSETISLALAILEKMQAVCALFSASFISLYKLCKFQVSGGETFNAVP